MSRRGPKKQETKNIVDSTCTTEDVQATTSKGRQITEKITGPESSRSVTKTRKTAAQKVTEPEKDIPKKRTKKENIEPEKAIGVAVQRERRKAKLVEPDEPQPVKRGKPKQEVLEEMEPKEKKKKSVRTNRAKSDEPKTVAPTVNSKRKTAVAVRTNKVEELSANNETAVENNVTLATKVRGKNKQTEIIATSTKEKERKGKSAKKDPKDVDEIPVPKKQKTGRKKKVEDDSADKDSEDDNSDYVLPGSKRKALSIKKVQEPKAKLNKVATDFLDIDFNVVAINKEWNLKISSWNVAGLRALTKKNGMDFVLHEKPDIFCLQEIKCTQDEVPDEATVKGYHTYWNAVPGGHGGVAIYSKVMPYNVEYGIGNKEHDKSGRIITAEYLKFFLVCVYVPNAGRKLVNLDKRMHWDHLFQKYLVKLNEKKPVIVCGDMNVAHEEIDLANPKTNKRSAGFTQEERDGMTKLLSLGFVDTFRELYPKKEKAYTFWTYMGNARSKNVGWRLDYFITSDRLFPKVIDNVMRTKVNGSDHCPITLFMNI